MKKTTELKAETIEEGKKSLCFIYNFSLLLKPSAGSELWNDIGDFI